jgi:hypothetical protein
MINSDMRASRPLARKLLYETWRHEKDVCLAFDSNTYPALMYFYAPVGPAAGQDGVCRCPVHCMTKLQAKHRRCLKVAVSIFESGCIIITGTMREEHALLVRDVVIAKLAATTPPASPERPSCTPGAPRPRRVNGRSSSVRRVGHVTTTRSTLAGRAPYAWRV